ncbi:uncharacterized protein I303_108166 [Kwoniella dejecticola CBS 10117]|uniref:Uncharacterized protein n=1 Tax=Kwoniella dejecticola CBS 10117 TaxID=1296121 RepID=A0A1A5ZY56_9TREE|nr:uncharacterized protein I303_07508 [Kwoniella dejecticola CBS 10117]OBR82741.1 hypothetical protein I303_07508 [Kwoniella dejecticola CBS 10117]
MNNGPPKFSQYPYYNMNGQPTAPWGAQSFAQPQGGTQTSYQSTTGQQASTTTAPVPNFWSITAPNPPEDTNTSTPTIGAAAAPNDDDSFVYPMSAYNISRATFGTSVNPAPPGYYGYGTSYYQSQQQQQEQTPAYATQQEAGTTTSNGTGSQSTKYLCRSCDRERIDKMDGFRYCWYCQTSTDIKTVTG